jgi:uncharacterized iron-regulated membrane protein
MKRLELDNRNDREGTKADGSASESTSDSNVVGMGSNSSQRRAAPLDNSSTPRFSRRYWTRRIHALLGVISAFNLIVLISTGFLLQHRDLLHLDEHSVTRRILPSRYRPDDAGDSVRADIVVADLHSGRMYGAFGLLVLDLLTLAWMIMLLTGLIMYFSGRRSPRQSRQSE